MKKISVIIPIYNVEHYITDTINSLINQIFKNFELIIIDDGTPDDSAKIAEDLLVTSGLDYSIIHTVNRGVSAARNKGLESASGDYVIMVDGDDVLTPDFLQTYANLIIQFPHADVISTSFTIHCGKQVIEQPTFDSEVTVLTKEEALIGFYNRKPRFLLPTLLLSRSFIYKYSIRFDEEVKYSEDVQFIWRVLAYNKKDIIHSSYSGYLYILHQGSTMTASGVHKILTWCRGFDNLKKEIFPILPTEIQEHFSPMGYFAMLHGASKMLSYDAYMEVFAKADCAHHLIFPKSKVPFKVKLVTLILGICPYLGYVIMKKF